MPRSSLIGVILAGGQSSRMGADKAQLCLNGETLLLRARRILLETGCAEILMSGPERANWPYTYITDATIQTGPVGGVVSVIRVLNEKTKPLQMVFVPVDTPRLQSELLRTLVSAAVDTEACLFENSPLPVVLTMTPHLVAQAHKVEQALLAGYSRSMRAFVSMLTSCYLPRGEIENEQLRNVNTPQEWASINALCEQNK